MVVNYYKCYIFCDPLHDPYVSIIVTNRSSLNIDVSVFLVHLTTYILYTLSYVTIFIHRDDIGYGYEIFNNIIQNKLQKTEERIFFIV